METKIDRRAALLRVSWLRSIWEQHRARADTPVPEALAGAAAAPCDKAHAEPAADPPRRNDSHPTVRGSGLGG